MPSFIANRLIRFTLVATGTTAAVAAFTPAASAGGFGGVGASCSSNQAACTVTAQDPGGSTAAGTAGVGTSGSESGSSSSTSTPVCTEHPITLNAQQMAEFGSPAKAPGTGQWVVVVCQIAGTNWGVPTIQWQPKGKTALPDPEVLAARAESKLTLVKPVVESSPAPGKAQVVQLPTWTWMPQAQWAPISATASVPGETVTATASPVLLSFSWGDGTTSTCQGPGTPYVSGTSDASAPSPSCGHTYQVTSAGQSDQQFPVTATLSWKIAWNGGGKSGTFPDLTTTTTVHWKVEQVESVLVGGGAA